MNRTFATIALALAMGSGLWAAPGSADDWSVTLDTPDQTVAPGATASFSGTITNGTGAALSIDAAIDFLASPESNDFEIVFSSGLAALGLLVPTTGYTGPLFEITWGAGVSGGTTAGGHLQLATSGPATPLELSIPFTLRTPGVGAFCTQRVGLTAATSSIASHDSTVISPQIAWHDPGVGIIGFSSTNGATWTHATIATGITGTAAPSLVLDAGRMPHIAYYHAGLGNLVHSWATNGQWATETVDAPGDVGGMPSLAPDAFGNLHVSYHDVANGDLKYARKVGTAWTTEVVDTTGVVGSNSSIVVDDAGVPHVSYYDATLGDLKYATKSGGVWTTTTVEAAGTVGSWSAIQVREGLVSIAYRDATPGSPRVRFASGPGADWTLETVDATGDPGIGSQLELNNFGEPRIAYFDQATQRVLFAAKAGATWAVGEVDVQATGAIGLARTEADEPILSYTVQGGSALRYASLGVCGPLAVDDRGAVGPRLVVYPNRPNPFTHGTVISFAVREASAMRVRIFDAAGRLVAEPLRKTLAAGTHQVEWNGVGNSRQRLPAGMYVYEVRSASDVRRGRMVLLR